MVVVHDSITDLWSFPRLSGSLQFVAARLATVGVRRAFRRTRKLHVGAPTPSYHLSPQGPDDFFAF